MGRRNKILFAPDLFDHYTTRGHEDLELIGT